MLHLTTESGIEEGEREEYDHEDTAEREHQKIDAVIPFKRHEERRDQAGLGHRNKNSEVEIKRPEVDEFRGQYGEDRQEHEPAKYPPEYFQWNDVVPVVICVGVCHNLFVLYAIEWFEVNH